MSKLRPNDNSTQNARGKCRFIYGSRCSVIDSDSHETYDIEVLLEREDGHRLPIVIPIARVWQNRSKDMAQWTTQGLADALLHTLSSWNALYGPEHHWIYHPRRMPPQTDQPMTQNEMQTTRKAILDGPDTPSRRWLLEHKTKPLSDKAIFQTLHSLPREPGQEG